MLDFLKDILKEHYTEALDKEISAEIGRRFVSKSDFDTVNEAKKQLEKTLRDRDGQLEALRRKDGDAEALRAEIARLQGENKKAEKVHEAELKGLRLRAAAERALFSARARNTKAVMALLSEALFDPEKAEIDDKGTVKGLAEEIASLRKDPDTAFLFGEEKQSVQSVETPARPRGMVPAESADGAASGMTKKQLRAMSPAERYDFSVKHPDIYKSIYGGTS